MKTNKEQIMVFSKEWFKKHNKTLCWFANTPIIKYWFRWLLRIHKDIKWSDKVEEIMPHAFTYGKKTILADCILIKGQWYVFDENNSKHKRLKNRGKREKKLVTQQTTDFRTHEKFGKRLYYGLRPLWYILHFWDWATYMQPKLNVGFDTLTVYSESGMSSTNDTCDAALEKTTKGTWSQIRDASECESVRSFGNIRVALSRDEYDKYYNLVRSGATFDTSDLGSGATISAAKIQIYPQGKADNKSVKPEVNIYSFSPESNGEFVVGDYSKFGTTKYCDTAITYDNFDISGKYIDFSYNSTGKSSISKTGITKVGWRSNFDATDTEPGFGSLTSYYYMYWYAADETGTTKDPKLVITYTPPVVAPTVTTQAVDQIATTSVRGNGNITATGGANATRRGFCYKAGTSGDPTTSDSVAYDDGDFGTGAFTKTISGLTPNTSYRVRAYAVNSAGTSYGTTVTVKTLSEFIPKIIIM